MYWNSRNKDDDIHPNKPTQCDKNECNLGVHPTPEFLPETVFNSYEDLINWVQNVGSCTGYVFVIQRSKNDASGILCKVWFQCDRGGTYKVTKISSKNTSTKKINCPFQLIGQRSSATGRWKLRMICETHNHDPALYMEGHSYARRFSENETQLVKDLSSQHVQPRDILSTLKNQDPDNFSIIKDIYNERQKIRISENAGRTQRQTIISFLYREGYIFYSRESSSTNDFEDLFFAHPRSLEIWRAFPHVVLMDATYKTNMYDIPLLEIVGATSTNKTFCIAFVFMNNEDSSSYIWALNCLKSTMDGCISPRVIVTDRELALMKACSIVFPDAKRLLCRWHILTSIGKRYKGLVKPNQYSDIFLTGWKTLVKSETEEAYECNFAQLEVILLDYPADVLDYLNNTWLNKYKEMFVSVWTDQYLHFGNQTTNRVESQHAKLKLYLRSTKSNIKTCLMHIHELVQSQDTSIKASLEYSIITRSHQLSIPHFKEVSGFVSRHALDILFNEYERSKAIGYDYDNCGCQLRTSYGLPCAHEQALYCTEGRPIPLNSIDRFWKKLDLLPCMPLKDDLERFTKQSISRKSSWMKKVKEKFVPSTTLVKEPVVHQTTARRPSLQNNDFRRSHFVDPPPQTQNPPRRSCASTSEFVDLDDSKYWEPARHSSYAVPTYYTYPYIDQFPNMFHTYISKVQNVRADGNCGFRAISVCLGYHEDQWVNIRRNLIQEVDHYKEEYDEMFGGSVECDKIRNALDFSMTDLAAPYAKWTRLPDMGFLIASKFNVILHVLTNSGSATYLPLRSTPPELHNRVAIAIGHVDNNHFVSVSLTGEYPVPYIMQQWFHSSYSCALEWATPYMDRIKLYTENLP